MTQKQGRRFLITGGAGFIGSALCRFLIEKTDAHILNLDALTYAANPASLAGLERHPRYAFRRVNVCDAAPVQSAFADFQPDAVMHLAAETHVDRSISGPAPFIETNMLGTFILLEAARAYWSGLPGAAKDAFRFLHVSTDEVFGSLNTEGLFHEHSPYDPSSPYSASKAGGDHLVTAWHRTYGLPTILVNCSNCYGPYQVPEKLIPFMTLCALQGKPLPLYGDGLNIRDWLFVDDAARGFYTLVQKAESGARATLSARNEHTNREIVKMICVVMDQLKPESAPHEKLITFVADRPGHDRRYGIDPSHAERTYGWRAETPFRTALENTVRWYVESRSWWEGKWEAGS